MKNTYLRHGWAFDGAKVLLFIRSRKDFCIFRGSNAPARGGGYAPTMQFARAKRPHHAPALTFCGARDFTQKRARIVCARAKMISGKKFFAIRKSFPIAVQ